MKISQLKYEDLDSGWALDNVSFKNTTLLVGASGVGKTQILEALMRLKDISNGKSFSGVKWELNFEILNKKTVSWTGEFEKKGFGYFLDEDEKDYEQIGIIHESLSINGKSVITRKFGKIEFNDYKIPKLASHISAINILKQEDIIDPIFRALQNIIFTDHSDSNRRENIVNTELLEAEKLLKKYNTIEKIRESELKLNTKLFLCFHNAKKVATQIKNRFLEVFPFVIDIRYEPLQNELKAPAFVRALPFIQLKEANVDNWIPQFKLSSGMIRTLKHISAIYLCSEGTVLLIDEFENSLGVNCIDELTSEIFSGEKRNLQFIITSHHPYILNRIEPSNWKLVTRYGSNVKARDAANYVDFSKSKQTAFIQLTQLDEFNTGIGE